MIKKRERRLDGAKTIASSPEMWTNLAWSIQMSPISSKCLSSGENSKKVKIIQIQIISKKVSKISPNSVCRLCVISKLATE